MIRVALRGLLGRKLRAALTAIAVVLGVAMVSGTFVLTDSIDKAFNSIFTDVRQGSDVVVSGKSAFKLSDQGTTAPSFDESVLQQVRALPDVAAAEPSVSGQAQLIGSDGKAIVYGGAPNLGFSIANGDSRFNPLALVQGSWPGANEVVVDKSTAGKEHLRPGQTIGVQAEGPVQQLRISGIVKFGSVSTIGGATLAGFDLPTAQRLFGKRGKLDEIAVAARPGVTDTKLVDEVGSVLPPTAEAKSATQQAESDAEDTNSFISFLRGFLLAFGGIALFVGSFVIANSLSITIAQRTREFATLRTLGAARRQVLGSIVVESLVVGTLASVIGLFSGFALAKGLFRLFDAVGFTLPNSGLVFAPRTFVVALLVGILVTLVASLRPAIRATRVPPIAAAREGSALPPSRFARFRTLGSAVLTALGFGALLYGLFGPGLGTTGILVWMGVGALLIFCGVALLVGAARPPARGHARLAGIPDRRRRRRARARQHPARSAADRLDGGRADDRPRARDARRGARGRDHEHLPLGRQRPLAERRLRGDGAEQLLADPDERGRRGRGRAGRRGGRERAHRRRARVRQALLRDRGRPRGGARLLRRLVAGLEQRPRLARRRRRLRRQGLRGQARPDASARRSS